MKKFLFLLLLSSVSYAAEQEYVISDLSGGMNSYISANKIPQNTASYIQNFFTDVESLGVERNGYVTKDTTVLGGGLSVTGLWRLLDNTGQEWIISFSSRTFYKNIIGGIPASVGWTITSDNVPSCTVNLGKIWCVNGVDDLQWFDGTSTGAVTSAPKGRIASSWRSHIVIGNIPNELTTVYVSGNNDGTNWTLGSNATDPFTIYVGGANNGDYVRCMSPGLYLDTLVISQKYATWGLSGFTQADWQLRNISAEVGCIENGSMKEFDGSLMFLSARGLEEMKGTEIMLVSEPVRNYTDSLVKNSNNQRSNVQSSQVDWGAGSGTSAVYLDTETAPGSVQFTFPDSFDVLRSTLTAGSKKVWTDHIVGSAAGAVISANGTLNITHPGNAIGWAGVRTIQPLVDFRQGTTYHFKINAMPSSPSSTSMRFILSSTATTSASFPSGWTFHFYSSMTNNVGYMEPTAECGSVSPGFTRFSVDIPFTTDIYLDTATVQVSVNGSSVIYRAAHTSTCYGSKYAYLMTRKLTTGASTYIFDDFGVAPQTMTYTSQPLSVGSLISSWSNVTISDSKTNSGAITYLFGSTNTTAVPINYQTATSGYVPTVATDTYAGFQAIFTNYLTTGTAQLAAFTTVWNEGGVQPSPVSGIYDRRYWLSFTTNTSGTIYQDTILVYQRNKTFSVLKGINAASFTYPLWRDKLYFGNSIGNGYVYEFDTGNNDDETEITSQIKTRSYDLGSSIREKDLRNAWVTYTGNTGFSGNFNLSYFLDRSTTSFNLGTTNMNDETGQIAADMPFPMSNALQGREFQYLLTKQGTGDRLKLHDIVTKFSVKEER